MNARGGAEMASPTAGAAANRRANGWFGWTKWNQEGEQTQHPSSSDNGDHAAANGYAHAVSHPGAHDEYLHTDDHVADDSEYEHYQ